MSYQIVKKLREENGEIVCSMCSNNVWPRDYYEWRQPNTEKWRREVRQFIIDRVWQPVNKNTKFIRSLNITHYYDGNKFYND